MEGTRAAGRRPFMPASRILEGSLPEQQPKGPDFFWRPTTTQNGARAGYQGQSPWLVRLDVWFGLNLSVTLSYAWESRLTLGFGWRSIGSSVTRRFIRYASSIDLMRGFKRFA